MSITDYVDGHRIEAIVIFLSASSFYMFMWRRFRRPQEKRSLSASVSYFSPVDCYFDNEKRERCSAYLRSFSGTKASLVVATPSIHKGIDLFIDFSQVIGSQLGLQKAKVLSSKKFGASGEGWLLKVQLIEAEAPASAIPNVMENK